MELYFHIPGICIAYTKYIQGIYKVYTRYIPGIFLVYASNIQLILLVYCMYILLISMIFSGFRAHLIARPASSPLDILDDPHPDQHFSLPDQQA